MNVSWNDRIRQERIRRNWRQQDLADQLGTTIVTIQRWERGAQQPSVYFRVKLCALFDKSAEELGLLPAADPQDNESNLSTAGASPVINTHPCAEVVPETLEAEPTASLTMVSPSTSSPPQKQRARSTLLTRRHLLVGLAGGMLASAAVAGGLVLFLRPHPSASVAGTTLFTYQGHTAKVRAVAWCPKDQTQRIASAGEDGTVQVWTPRLGTEHTWQTYQQHPSGVYALAWSPEGQWIASAGLEVHVWNAFSGDQRFVYRGHTAKVNAVAWSPDGRYLASGSVDKTVQVWDAVTGNLHLTPLRPPFGHRDAVTGVTWSPDGRYLAASSTNHQVWVWDASTGTSQKLYSGHTSSVEAVAWSPDSQYLASGGEDQTLQIWNPLEGTRYWSSQQSSRVWAVAWSPNSRQAAAADAAGIVQVLDIPGVHLRLRYTGHHGEVRAVAWSPDRTRIASGGQDKTVQVWQAL